jgi:hypothetical protein
VRKVRPPKTKAYLTLSFAPGECAQVDWGCYGSVNVGGTRRRLNNLTFLNLPIDRGRGTTTYTDQTLLARYKNNQRLGHFSI